MLHNEFNTKINTLIDTLETSDLVERYRQATMGRTNETAINLRLMMGGEDITRLQAREFGFGVHPFNRAMDIKDSEAMIVLPLMDGRPEKNNKPLLEWGAIAKALYSVDFNRELGQSGEWKLKEYLMSKLNIEEEFAKTMVNDLQNRLLRECGYRSHSCLMDMIYVLVQILCKYEEQKDYWELNYGSYDHFGEVKRFTVDRVDNFTYLSIVVLKDGFVHQMADDADLIVLDNRQVTNPEELEHMGCVDFDVELPCSTVDARIKALDIPEHILVDCRSHQGHKRRVRVFYPKDDNAVESLLKALEIVRVLTSD